jgi:hypothetical protein
MKTMLSVIVAVLLLVSYKAADEQVRIGNNLRNENVLMPFSAPDKSRLILNEYVMLCGEAGTAGILAFYDDLQTKLKIDYIELYDLSGNLLLVSWIDRFGISRFAVDRGLLKENPVVDRVLVLVNGGAEA